MILKTLMCLYDILSTSGYKLYNLLHSYGYNRVNLSSWYDKNSTFAFLRRISTLKWVFTKLFKQITDWLRTAFMRNCFKLAHKFLF